MQSRAIDDRKAKTAGEARDSIARAIADIRDLNTQIVIDAEEQSAVAEEIERNFNAISLSAEQSAESTTETSHPDRSGETVIRCSGTI